MTINNSFIISPCVNNYNLFLILISIYSRSSLRPNSNQNHKNIQMPSSYPSPSQYRLSLPGHYRLASEVEFLSAAPVNQIMIKMARGPDWLRRKGCIQAPLVHVEATRDCSSEGSAASWSTKGTIMRINNEEVANKSWHGATVISDPFAAGKMAATNQIAPIHPHRPARQHACLRFLFL